jgi:hypothetical protein
MKILVLHRRRMLIKKGRTFSAGTDVMILKYFRRKILRKNRRFLTQNKAKFWKKVDHNIGI